LVSVFAIPKQPGVATIDPGVIMRPDGKLSTKNALMMGVAMELTTAMVKFVVWPRRIEIGGPNVLDKGFDTTFTDALFDIPTGKLDDTANGAFVKTPSSVAFTDT
jgi:hypothetical protein